MAAIKRAAIAVAAANLRSFPSGNNTCVTQARLHSTSHRTSFLSGSASREKLAVSGGGQKSRSEVLSIYRTASSTRSFSATAKAMAPIQLYSMATPNGQKIPIALEELGVAYEAHLVDISKGDQFRPEFVKVNPNSKIPAIVDPEGPDGQPLSVFESGAILLYLAEKYGALLPKDPAKKWEAIQWLFFQVGGIGPMMGQLGHFNSLSKDKMDHPYPKERYLTEVKRLFKVVDGQLAGKEYIVGEYSVADIALAPWMNGARGRMAAVFGDLSEYPNVAAWLDRVYARPAVQKGITVCAKS